MILPVKKKQQEFNVLRFIILSSKQKNHKKIVLFSLNIWIKIFWDFQHSKFYITTNT